MSFFPLFQLPVSTVYEGGCLSVSEIFPSTKIDMGEISQEAVIKCTEVLWFPRGFRDARQLSNEFLVWAAVFSFPKLCLSNHSSKKVRMKDVQVVWPTKALQLYSLLT